MPLPWLFISFIKIVLLGELSFGNKNKIKKRDWPFGALHRTGEKKRNLADQQKSKQ